MKGKSYWYGKEVEGRLFGLYTLFNRHELGKITNKVQHLYFTIEFWKTKDCIEIIESLLIDYPISIEVNEEVYKYVTPNMKVRAHLIYRIQDKNVFDLKETDSVFVDGNMYNVLCFTKHNALKVNYTDYSNDTL